MKFAFHVAVVPDQSIWRCVVTRKRDGEIVNESFHDYECMAAYEAGRMTMLLYETFGRSNVQIELTIGQKTTVF